jgi:hypothetical protein
MRALRLIFQAAAAPRMHQRSSEDVFDGADSCVSERA